MELSGEAHSVPRVLFAGHLPCHSQGSDDAPGASGRAVQASDYTYFSGQAREAQVDTERDGAAETIKA